VAKQLDGSRCQLVQRLASAQATLCQMGTQLPPKGAQPLNFPPMSVVAKRSPISATAELLDKRSPKNCLEDGCKTTDVMLKIFSLLQIVSNAKCGEQCKEAATKTSAQ